MIGKIVIGIIIIIVVLGLIAGQGKEDTNTTKQENSVSQQDQPMKKSTAENACQDAAFIRKYVDDNIALIKITNYDAQFFDSGDKAPNGDAIWYLTWNGKNKTTDENVNFVCKVSGTDDNVTIHSLSANGQVLYNIE